MWALTLQVSTARAEPSTDAAPQGADTPEPGPASTLLLPASDSAPWMRRFELERPRILRYVEGMPVPEGYERETHYDWAQIARGGGAFAGGWVFTALAARLLSNEWVGLVPCGGPFLVDNTSGPEAGFIAAVLTVTGCAGIVVGAVEITRGFALGSPVLVRKESPGSVHAMLVPRTRNKAVELGVAFIF